MPATRAVKRTASKSSAATTTSSAPKNKKKRAAFQLEIPSAPKRRGKVLACGQGDVGQLGLGEDVVETTKFKLVSALGDKVVDVCAGGMHTVALDTDGKVWTFGCNDEGALGRPTAGEGDEGKPGKVTLPGKAVAVSAGDSHTAALLQNGDVFAWGSFRDSHGSMGLVVRGREGKPCRDPVKVELGEPAGGIASGGDHLVVLSTSGAVYTMGCGEQGQLGRVSQRSASREARSGFSTLLTPCKVTLKAQCSRVWAGYHGTFVWDAGTDTMHAWGLNNYSQLGITGEKRKAAIYAPTVCDAFKSSRWKEVAVGQHHSLAMDEEGKVFSVGRCEYGRLGLGDRTGDAETLEPVPNLQDKKCVSISAGTSNSFAVTDTGSVFAWGMGSEGQLGTGTSSDATEPKDAVLESTAGVAAAVSAGGQHTVVLLDVPNAKKSPTPEPEEEPAEEKTEDREKEKRGRKRPKKEQEEEISSTSSAQVSADEVPQKLNSNKKKIETPMEVDEIDKPQEPEKESEETKIQDKETDDSKNKSKDNKEDNSATDLIDNDIEMTDSKPEKEEKVDPKPETVKAKSETVESKPEAVESKPEAVESKTPAVDSKPAPVEPTVEAVEKKSETVESIPETVESKPEKVASLPEKVESLPEKMEVEAEKPEVNGTPEVPKVETKTVEGSIPAANVLTTTA